LFDVTARGERESPPLLLLTFGSGRG